MSIVWFGKTTASRTVPSIEVNGTSTSALEIMAGVRHTVHGCFFFSCHSKTSGNQKAQFYTDRIENARYENRRLIIEAHCENYSGQQFTSARLKSKHDWTYGRLQVCFYGVPFSSHLSFRRKRKYQAAEVSGQQSGW